MKHLALKVPVWEYERGWGSKIDDFMVCLSKEDATEFVKEFNAENKETSVPDWYMVASTEFTPIDLTDSEIKAIKKQKDKRMWLNALRK